MGPVVIIPIDKSLAARLPLTPEQLAGSLDPMADGLRIIEEQRGVSAPQGGREEPSYGVGGFAQMTMVSRDMIGTQVVRRWPDEIGRRLGLAG